MTTTLKMSNKHSATFFVHERSFKLNSLITFNQMKNIIILSVCILLHVLAFSQEADSRLTKSYTKKEITDFKATKPEYYRMLVYALDNACYIAGIPVGKEFKEDGIISIDPKSKPSFTDIGARIKNQNQYFLIKNTNNILVIKSEWVLNNELTRKK